MQRLLLAIFALLLSCQGVAFGEDNQEHELMTIPVKQWVEIATSDGQVDLCLIRVGGEAQAIEIKGRSLLLLRYVVAIEPNGSECDHGTHFWLGSDDLATWLEEYETQRSSDLDELSATIEMMSRHALVLESAPWTTDTSTKELARLPER